MPQSTPKLGLVCYDLVNDGGVYFSVFRNTLAGYTNSALTKIDDFALRIDNDVTQLKLNPPIVRVSAIKTDDFLYEVVGITEITEYRNNVYINLSLDFTNMGTVSLNINNLGTRGVYKIGDDGLIANLSAGDLKQNKMHLFRYNGTYWVWVNAVTSDQLNVVGTVGNLTKISENNTLEDSGVTFSNTTTNNALIQRTSSGQVKGVTPVDNDDLSNKAYVDTKAPISSPTLTGTPLAPTATVGANTTQIATTAFVNSEINNDRPYGTITSTLVNDGTGVIGTSTKVAREDHTHTMPNSVLQSQVINDLTTGGETDVLSAEQGRVLKNLTDEHIGNRINTVDGVHGFRYYNETLQFDDGAGNWIDIETGGGGIAPNNVSGISIKVGNGKLEIKWSDPDDTIIEGQVLSTWKGTKLVQKVGSFPDAVNDGVLLLDNRTRNAYATNGFEITGLTNGTVYYYQLFPYSDTGATNENIVNRISGTPQLFRVMGVNIDLTNSNPATSITYTDDAVGMTPGSVAWDEFFGHYPVMLLNGVENYKLNPNNFAQKLDGSAANITSGTDGDVMIAFPRRGLTISTSGNIVTIKMTEAPDDAAFEYNAHTRGITAKEKFYLGAYKGNTISSKLRSLSGKAPTATQTIGTFRTQAQANGAGYDQSGFYQLTFRQVMYLLKYKNLNSQTAVGRGYVDGNTAAINTGNTNTKGMDFGETTGKLQMKLFGLEDFWGNVREWIDGMFSNSTRNILTATDDFNDTGAGYMDNGQGATANVSGYMSKPQGTTKAGFITKEASGSETTYFTDYAHLIASCLPYFGGSWVEASAAGAFYLYLADSASTSDASLGGRLMYL